MDVLSHMYVCRWQGSMGGVSLSISFYYFWRRGVSLTLELTWFLYVGSRGMTSRPRACKARTFLIAPSPQQHPSLALLRCSWLSPTCQLTLQMD